MHAEHADNPELNELSGRVIGCAFTVLNALGAGFLEKVYETASAYEVRAAGLSAVQQYGAKVHYKDILVAEYFADLPINDVLLVELKTVKALDDAHRMQCTGDQTRGTWPISRAEPSACSACIAFLHLR